MAWLARPEMPARSNYRRCVVQSWQQSACCAAGAILTKMDGDSRGGAALSVHAVSGKPIKFMGTGEGLDALEPFYPDRIASRVLGEPSACWLSRTDMQA